MLRQRAWLRRWSCTPVPHSWACALWTPGWILHKEPVHWRCSVGGIRVCNMICAARVRVIQLTSERTEISTSRSMSEQALWGQMIQGSGLQSCWDEQKADALQGVWHLTFTGASLSLAGDHSAAVHPDSCKSDFALYCPGESPPQGSHHLNCHLTKGPR